MTGRILPILAIVIAVGIFVGYVRPVYGTDVAALRSEIGSYDNALSAAGAYSAKQNDLTAKRNAIPGDKLSRLASFLPDGVDNVRLILDLDALAARSGTRLSNFDVNTGSAAQPLKTAAGSAIPLATKGPVDSLDLSMTLVGTYDSFITFLSGVQQSLRLLDVTELSVKDSTTGVYTFDVTLRIYWLH